tara:strand:- start:247 stop:576 length:330 start_codon:yes stop_codon:yes gene_type:complete
MNEIIDIITTATYSDYENDEIDLGENSYTMNVGEHFFRIMFNLGHELVDVSTDPNVSDEQQIDIITKVTDVYWVQSMDYNDPSEEIELDLSAQEREYIREQIQLFELND